jgi:hypothetical protein
MGYVALGDALPLGKGLHRDHFPSGPGQRMVPGGAYISLTLTFPTLNPETD